MFDSCLFQLGRGGWGRVSTLYTLSCCFSGSFQYNFISFIYQKKKKGEQSHRLTSIIASEVYPRSWEKEYKTRKIGFFDFIRLFYL